MLLTSVMAFFIFVIGIWMLEIIKDRIGFHGFEPLKSLLIVLIVMEAIACILFIFCHGGFKRCYQEWVFLSHIEKNLISAGIVLGYIGSVAILPRVKLDMNRLVVSVSVDNVKIRSKLESIEDLLSTALPAQFNVRKAYISPQYDKLYIEFYEASEARLIYYTAESYIKSVQHLSKTQLMMDKNITIDLKDYPHLLVTGGTGSGKSYYAMQVILQGLIRGWSIQILDFKRSYHAFKSVCEVAFTVDQIISTLRKAIEELHRRQEAMASVLESNPNALAIDHGFPVVLIVVEEYIALMNCGIEKKTQTDIEKMLLELVTVGRSLNIHLMMVMQVASAASLNTSVRANLPVRIVFGNAPRTILETTFGISDVPVISQKFEKGQGLIKLELDAEPFSAPTLAFNFNEVIQILEHKV